MSHLAVIETHPVQYHAPVYQRLQEQLGIHVTALYGSDFSVAGYRDAEFGATFAWDTDLLAGYTSHFLGQVAAGGPPDAAAVRARGLDKALRRANPSAVLLTGYASPFHQQAFRAAWQAGYPLLFRAETTDHALARGRTKGWLRDLFLRWFYGRQAALLYIGQRSLAHYQRLAGQQPRFFAPYCVDPAPFRPSPADREALRPATRRALGLANDEVALLFAGKLVEKKGPELILRALKALGDDERARMVVLFLGDGPLRPTLEQLAAEEPTVATRFLGFKNQRELSPTYHAADLLVLPSQFGETWGLVVNEALHHGLPCIVSTQVGCAPDLVVPDATGEIFEAGHVASLVAALRRAARLLDRSDTPQRCREQVSRYTVERAAEGIAEAFWQVTGQPHAMASRP